MSAPQLSARARLTLLYTALVGCCGAVLVSATYLLVSHNLQATRSTTTKTTPPAGFMNKCIATQQAVKPSDPSVKNKCVALFNQGATSGAQAQRASTLSHLLWYSLTALVAITALAAVIGWVLAGRILRPVHQLTAAARTASEHNLSQRLALPGPRDELRELADTFDDMLARLDAAFNAQRQFIANASHELRTPLTVMRTTVDVVLAKPAATNAELVDMGSDIRREVNRANQLIDALLTLARNERGRTVTEQVDLATLAEDVLDSSDIDELKLEATLESAPIGGDPVLLGRLIANLVDNAIRYNAPGGTVVLTTGRAATEVSVRVVNTGPLVPAEVVDNLFQPFTRLDDRTSHEGFGLGLALVASITAIHHGTIYALANPEGGLDVTVTLPAAPA
jgi:signal transduction histidine kinase